MTNEERLAALETGQKNIYHQLDDIQAQVSDIHELSASVKVIATEMKNVSTKVDSVDERLSEIEKEPAKAFTHYKQQIIGYIITGVIGVLLGSLMAAIIR